MVILDTDVLSELMRRDDVAVGWLDRQPATSIWTTAINVLEIRYGLAIMPQGRRRSMQLNEFERLIADDLDNRILVFDRSAAEHTASLMASRQSAGRPRELRDTMIAGIALSQRATLATRNTRHFDDLNVPVINPWRP
jgi:predicted nucleic acid-binding protein